MELGVVRQVDIDRQMQQAYLDYAMSVIVSRALPDARDGLKPVHRRILYAMHDMGLRSNQSYRKSARIVGEVLGKYHPHGDMAVYEAMVRMAQDFSMRVMLVDGQGNFGSVDGDAPAAMRYTEARLAPAAAELLRDLEKDTVDWIDNFDGTLQEPTVLPSNFPNLLVNGSAGIAVGMATSIPPHNLGEIVDALVHVLDHWERQDDISVDDLMQFVHGPDFPTGAILFRRDSASGEDALRHAYASGRGKFVLQARAHIEEMSRGRSRIVVTELPYQVNKSALQERIADLVREEKLAGLTDVRDESDRQGMRLVIELTRNVEPEKVLAELFQRTAMRDTFSINLLALVDGEPRLLSLKKALLVYLEHRLQIVRRRSQYDLKRARERAHILEGLIRALDNLDLVIDIIRRSKTGETARKNLMVQLKIDDRQADAILDLPLRRLAALERQKIEQEYKDKLKLIRELETLLANPKKQREHIKAELLEVKNRYGEARRTLILDQAKGMLSGQDLLPDEEVWVTITRGGLISRVSRSAGQSAPLVPPDAALSSNGDTSGAAPLASLPANTRDRLALFSADARAVILPVHQIPAVADPANGTHWADLTAFGRRDKVIAAFVYRPGLEGSIVLATMGGEVKRLSTAELAAPGAEPLSMMGLAEKDRLVAAICTPGDGEILLVTAAGQTLRIKEVEIRESQAAAGGVQGIRLGAGDRVIAADRVPPDGALLTISDSGYGKRTDLGEYPVKGRATSGVAAARLSPGAELVGAVVVGSEDRIVVGSSGNTVAILPVADIPLSGRATLGKPAVPLDGKERVKWLVRVPVSDRPGSEMTKSNDKAKSDKSKPARKARTATRASVSDDMEGRGAKAAPAQNKGRRTKPTEASASKAGNKKR